MIDIKNRTVFFGDLNLDAMDSALPAIAGFIDAVDEALADLSEAIVSNVTHLEDGDEIERDIDEFTSEIKAINNVMGRCYQNEIKSLKKLGREHDKIENPWDNGGKERWKEQRAARHG